MDKRRLGLIVNPVAGIGGKVGLKGSDGLDIQRKAVELGAVPEAPRRALLALERVRPAANQAVLITYPAEMGEGAVRMCGFEPVVIGTIRSGSTTAADTRRAAVEMLGMGTDLLLFAGGDGTARDIYDAVGTALPALGIPAGVKIHSAVFATNPVNAGELAAAYLRGDVTRLREVEVLDLDEEAVRSGTVAPRLYGYLKIPFERRLVQGLKVASTTGEAASLAGIATAVVEQMDDDCLYIIGPGTTTRAITDKLGLRKTLIGVDVVTRRGMVAEDANESQILKLIEGRRAKIIVTPVGGQGCIFGRGNQQISAQVIAKVGRDNIVVIATPDKIQSLAGQPLWVDTGDPDTDKIVQGYVRVVAGYREEIVIRVGN